MNNSLYLVLTGSLRKLGRIPDTSTQITLEKVGSGSLVGWVNIVRGEASELVHASTETVCLELSLRKFVEYIHENKSFASYFASTLDIQESYHVCYSHSQLSASKPSGWRENILTLARNASLLVETDLGENDFSSTNLYVLSSASFASLKAGMLITSNVLIGQPKIDKVFPLRVLSLPKQDEISSEVVSSIGPDHSSTDDLYSLGILESETLSDSQRYPIVRSRGLIGSVLAVLEMVSIEQRTL